METESVSDGFGAIDKLRERDYSAVVLDPIIRHRLNGYAVLNFIELEQPEMLERLFLLTGMSEQTIRRTAPSVLPRLFRKPSAVTDAAGAVIAACLPAHGQVKRKSKGTVLLVEDDLTTANATRSLLDALGYSSDWAQNGIGALQAIAAQDFDVIMLDLVMPHMDGFTVLEHFQSENPGLLRRVIVTTGIPDRRVQALDPIAIRGILQKPLDIKPLEQLLRDCISGRP
jgi:CheY-like chemotaxis protein